MSSIYPAHFGNEDQAKDHAGCDKHVRQKESDQYKYATERSNVDLQPSEEQLVARADRAEDEIERIIDSREMKGHRKIHNIYFVVKTIHSSPLAQLFFKARLQSQASHKACMTGPLDRQTFQLSLVLTQPSCPHHRQTISNQYPTMDPMSTKVGTVGDIVAVGRPCWALAQALSRLRSANE